MRLKFGAVNTAERIRPDSMKPVKVSLRGTKRPHLSGDGSVANEDVLMESAQKKRHFLWAFSYFPRRRLVVTVVSSCYV